MLFCSVPVLMLVVPPIEINVECHNAAGDHARDQRPEERGNKSWITKRIPQWPEQQQDGTSVRDCSMNELSCVMVKDAGHQRYNHKISNPPLQNLSVNFASFPQVCRESSWFHRVILYCCTPRASALNTQWAAVAGCPEPSSLLTYSHLNWF